MAGPSGYYSRNTVGEVVGASLDHALPIHLSGEDKLPENSNLSGIR